MIIKRHCQFLLDKEKGQPDAKLRYRIKWDKCIVAFNIGLRVEIDKWSLETQRCINNTTHGKKKIPASTINRLIRDFEQWTDEIFTSYENTGISPTAEEFKHLFNSKRGKDTKNKATEIDFFSLLDQFTRESGLQNSWSELTYKKFHALKKHLKDFNSNLALESLSDHILRNFIHYFIRLGYKNTTIERNISLLRWFLRWAYRKGYYTGNLHETFRPRLKNVDHKEIIFLTWDELLKVYHYPIPSKKKHLDHVRNVFCFCCFTGLRYSDVEKIKREDIRGEIIHIVTQKTSETLKIDLNDYSREILLRYKEITLPEGKVLPVISNQKMNDYLKELGELCELNEPYKIVYFIGNERKEEILPKWKLLSSHCGRRTFVVNAIYLGIPIEVIMKWTGHSDYRSMKPYIAIVDNLKASEMQKFNRR